MSEDWLKLLYDNNYDMLYRLASNRLISGMGHASDVQDVLQEVFVLASVKKICNHPNPEGWLIITTVNICKNYIQANARRIRKYDECVQTQHSGNLNSRKQVVVQNAEETQGSELRIILEQTLSPDEYELLNRYYIAGLSLNEISKDMNLSPNVLKVRLYRIRKKLKKYLD